MRRPGAMLFHADTLLFLLVSLALVSLSQSIAAHETTRKIAVPVQVQHINGRQGSYDVLFGCLPDAATTSEAVACEVKFVPATPNAIVTFQILEADHPRNLPVHRENESGVYAAEYR